MTTIEKFLTHFTPPVQEIALQVRDIAKTMLPNALEFVDSGDQVIRYATGTKRTDIIVYISAHKDSVNLGFFYGGNLPDPDNLLRGTGKRMRHIKFKAGNAVDTPAVRALLTAAWAEGQKSS